MTSYFENVKKNFGFGCMRLPMVDDKVDYVKFCEMVDVFMENGFNYFDTAHGYLNGQSEVALRECLTSRYPRESYILTNKLSGPYFNKNEDIRPLFEKQLEICGVDYFDFYLMHSQTEQGYAKFKECRAYETALELKAEGKIKHVGFSFHDTAEVLDRILTEYPEMEVVQLQFNYVDYDDVAVQGRLCYEVCRKHNKPVIVMEPVKGGNLVNLPAQAQAIFDELKGGSSASYAIRFAASFEDIFMVLSGMGTLEMVKENVGFMKDFRPLNEQEMEAVWKVCDYFKSQDLIPCTACRYCTEGCPMQIPIPDLFSCMNTKKQFNNWNADYYYEIHTKNGGKASACVECGLCEAICPQHLEIRALLKDVAAAFEKKEEK
ncbi:MAG: 4Fe-4S dicluster domain-containing protein [Lachnospiraceae bacterium]|nr:4Fe-4S dicluster domain-containing protein [Lachnospiraceae bacterium]